jgi:hypothetical protein
MYIHQIQRGTKFKFAFDEFTEIEGIYDGNIDHMQFYIVSLAISGDIDRYIDTEPEVSFILNEFSYSFKAKLLGISESKDAIHASLEFRVLTPIKQAPLRSKFRIDIGLKVRIHKFIDDYKAMYSDGLICESLSENISKSGIRLFCDYLIDEPLDTKFTLEFTLQNGSLYMIPSILKRNSPNYETRSYNYDYGFAFDFDLMPEKHENLILEILEHKIKHRL